MSMPYRIRVPSWVDREGRRRGGYITDAALVCKLDAGKTPHPKLVDKFYGPDAPKHAYLPKKVDRLVFERKLDDYVIIPDTPRTRKLWWPL